MSTDLAPQQGKPTGLKLWTEDPAVRGQITAALGDWMGVDTFLVHTKVSFQEDNVRECTDASKYKALMELAALTLLPTLGQVALVPYRNKQGKKEIKVTPQWQGFKAIMERHPSVLEVSGQLVHHTDDFCVLNGEMRHSYNPFDPARTITGHDSIQGGYCKIVYSDGRAPRYHFVPVSHIRKVSGCAQTQKVWNAWYEQMALKTLYRDTFARRVVPIDPLVAVKLQAACAIEDVNLGNNPMRVTTEATEQHIEQARQQREAAEPEPTVLEELAERLEEPPESVPDDIPDDIPAEAIIEEFGAAIEAAADSKTPLSTLEVLETAAREHPALSAEQLKGILAGINGQRKRIKAARGKNGGQDQMFPEGGHPQ